MTLIPSLEAVAYLRKLKSRNIGIIGFEGFRAHGDGGWTALLERIADFSSLLEDSVTWEEFLQRSHDESVQVLAKEWQGAPDIAYEFVEANEEDWKTSKARESPRR